MCWQLSLSPSLTFVANKTEKDVKTCGGFNLLWRRPRNGVKDAIVGPDSVATQMKSPVHWEENVVVD